MRHALEVRGIKKKYLKHSSARELSRAVRLPDKEGNRAVWLCITCDASWCAACGCELPFTKSQRDRKNVHTQCRGKQRYEIYKSLLDLEAANRVYTQGKHSFVGKNCKASNIGDTIWANGTGYGGEYIDSRNRFDLTQAAARKEELELDSHVEKQIAFLTSVLKGQSPFLTISICATICWENILPRILQQLVKNDSMLDISDRSKLYLQMVSLLNEMQRHGELHSMLAGWGEEADDDVAADRDNSLIIKLGNIYRQAKVMIQNMPQTDGNHGADVDMSLARELCKCYENLEVVISKQDTVVCEGNNNAASQTAVEAVRTDAKAKQLAPDDQQLSATRYKEALGKMQFRQLCMADERGVYRHHFKDNINGTVANSTCIDKRGVHNQKRMIHLSKEIASLATSLPLEWESSIHLCVDEARVDVLRALIIGPQGTPYQNGLFFFDIFLPPGAKNGFSALDYDVCFYFLDCRSSIATSLFFSLAVLLLRQNLTFVNGFLSHKKENLTCILGFRFLDFENVSLMSPSVTKFRLTVKPSARLSAGTTVCAFPDDWRREGALQSESVRLGKDMPEFAGNVEWAGMDTGKVHATASARVDSEPHFCARSLLQ